MKPQPDIDRWMRWAVSLAFVCASAAVWWPMPASATRLKEVASVQGVRSNELTGYGLVVGLDGTGDQTTQTPFTTQSLAAMLQQLGVTVPAGTSMQLRNVAAVLVTAQLPAFAKPGQSIDVTVASVGNAKSLRGGTLISTALRGADGEIYALAQGNLVVGGAGASANGSKVQINHLSAGRVPGGASVERAVPTPLMQGDTLLLGLAAADFNTARAVAGAINGAKGDGTAAAVDGRSVRVKVPADADARIGFLADIENLTVELARPAARVILNPRTGSVVINEAVTLSACAVAHGSLSVTISTTPVISQPAALSQGQTVQAAKSDIEIQQQGGTLIQLPSGARLTDVVKALNTLGATPMDLQAILEAMKSAGALNAEIEVIYMAGVGMQGLNVDASALTSLKARAASDPKAAIKETAKQFEALFMNEVVKSMRASTLATGMLDNAGSTMGTEMLDSQLASQLTGLPGGLSDVIAKQLERQMGLTPGPIPVTDSANNTPAPISATPKPTQIPQVGAAGFVQQHTADAQAAQEKTGIPAAFMVAQAAQETGWGRKEIRHVDGSPTFNLFAIKAGPGWTGPTADVTTTEYVNGKAQKVVAKFRAYSSYQESFNDYAKLMTESPRYQQTVAKASDASSFARGLQRAGYATDPAYADKLTKVINTTLRLQRAAA